MEKILPISLKLNFTPNTWGCYGLSRTILNNSTIDDAPQATECVTESILAYAVALSTLLWD